MIFHKLPLEGAFLIELEKKQDNRGFFARYFCCKEFNSAGLEANFVQINNSLSLNKSTLRGLHYQLPPHSENKMIRAIRGSLYDVIVDIRKDSNTFGKWFGAELNEENRLMMYVPKGFAHGFITLSDNTEAIYLVSDYYANKSEAGIRYNDPLINIHWPLVPKHLSDKDLEWPLLTNSFMGI